MSFLCPFCGKELCNKQSYSRHLSNIHNDKSLFKCSICEKQYRRKDNLRYHTIQKHVKETKDFYRKKCDICHKTVDRQKYKRHLVLMHRPSVEKVDDRPKVECSVCGALFRFKSSLSYHKKKVHKVVSTRPCTIKCPKCNFLTETGSTKSIYTHFKNIHGISMKYESYNFQSMQEFYLWKRQIEKETVSSFRTSRKENNFLKFRCHRSGRYKSTTRKRHLKVTGSCKINGFCPAFINVKIVNSNDINVMYQQTHVGHVNELRHIALTPDERKSIAVQLAKKVPSGEILKRIRCSLTNTPLQRIHLLNKKDLHNIKSSFDLNAIAADFDTEIVENKVFNEAAQNIELKLEETKVFSDVEQKIELDMDAMPFNIIEEIIELPSDFEAVTERSIEFYEENIVQVETVSNIDNLIQGTVNTGESNIEDVDSEWLQLDRWVENVKSSPSTALVLYKPIGCLDTSLPRLDGNDFLLILMTEAQKEMLIKASTDVICIENTYCHNLQLFALLSPDDAREGFPVAFMFTNREDETILSIFFEQIRNVVGYITPIAFMTDAVETYYRSWINIMGETHLHLYSTWHVLKVWKTAINNKINLKHKQNLVYKALLNLLYELDEGKFHNMLGDYVVNWNGDKELRVFSEYFHNTYIAGNQFKKWAYYCRVNIGTNINISVEIFNRFLKCCNMRREEKINHLGRTLLGVLNLLIDKLFELTIKINKGKVGKKQRNINLRHRHSYGSDSEYVIQEEDKWFVVNYADSVLDEMYTVKKVKECNSCLLQCDLCNSCFHEYICSCLDHLVKNNMCKHIHLVARTQKLMRNTLNGSDPENSMEIFTPDKAYAIANDLVSK